VSRKGLNVRSAVRQDNISFEDKSFLTSIAGDGRLAAGG
jgi:hypothetical protein